MFSNFIKLDLNYLKTKGIYVLTALISVFLMVYIGFQIKLSADDEICVSVIDNQKVSSYAELSGYIFMDEEYIVYPDDGCTYFFDAGMDGKYVDAGSKIGTVYKIEDAEKAEKIRLIDEKIALLTKCMVMNEGIIGSKEYDKDVKNAYNTIVDFSMTGNLFGLRSTRSSWFLAQGKKSIAVNYVTDYRKEIGRLRVEKARLLASFGNGEMILAPKSGRYYGGFDGYSEYFSYETARSGSYEELNGLLSGVDKIGGDTEGRTICGRLVRSAKWYFVAPVDSMELKEFSLGKSYEAEFEENNGMALTMTLERILSERGGGKAYAVFSSTDMPEGFEHIRFQNVRVKSADYEGLCVASSSVRYVDGELAVYIAKSDKIHLRKIKVLAEFGGMYIVKAQDDFTAEEREDAGESEYLKRYDTLIVSGKGLYEGKYIDMSRLKG